MHRGSREGNIFDMLRTLVRWVGRGVTVICITTIVCLCVKDIGNTKTTH